MGIPNVKESSLLPATTTRRFMEIARRGECLVGHGFERGLATKVLSRQALSVRVLYLAQRRVEETALAEDRLKDGLG